MTAPTLEEIRQAPKALLHDHLDGGLRPATIVELAAETGYADLPTNDAAELARWMTRGADRKDLVLYLDLTRQLGVTSVNGPPCLAAFHLAAALGYGDQISNRVVDAIGDIAGGIRIQDQNIERPDADRPAQSAGPEAPRR